MKTPATPEGIDTVNATTLNVRETTTITEVKAVMWHIAPCAVTRHCLRLSKVF